MTNDELQERLAYWQKRLRLADWYVTAKFVTIHELPTKTGNSHFDWLSKTALITMRREEDYGPDYLPDSLVDGEEETLVHELLHLTFAGFTEEQESIRDHLQHQAIHALAVALVEEHRLSSGHAKDAA